MGPLEAPARRISPPDEINADAEASSNRDADRALTFHHAHSLLLDEINADASSNTETSSRSFHHDGELSSHVILHHVKSW